MQILWWLKKSTQESDKKYSYWSDGMFSGRPNIFREQRKTFVYLILTS